MKSKILSKRIPLLIVIILGLVISAVLLLYFNKNNSIQGEPTRIIENSIVFTNQEQSSVEQVNVGLPTRVKIPKINVDATVIYVGLTSDGLMDSPKEIAEVAWYSLGPRPGENGSAVFAGHYGLKDNIPAVFDSLHKLSKGDKIYVEDDKGESTTFVVSESRNYDPNADTQDIFVSDDGKARLNLITCAGTWKEDEETFSERLIVFTVKE